MGLRDTLMELATSQEAEKKRMAEIPKRIENWNDEVQYLYKFIESHILDLKINQQIKFLRKQFKAFSGSALGAYCAESLYFDLFGKSIELKPFSGSHDEPENTVHMQKVGRSERIRFLFRNQNWMISIQPANEHNEYLEGREPIWNYLPLNEGSFDNALVFLLRTGERT